MKSIVFLENSLQLQIFMSVPPFERKDVTVIAVFPQVYAQAKDAGLPVLALDDFGDTSVYTVYNSEIVDNIQNLESIFDTLWHTLMESMQIAKCISFRAFFHSFKAFYDALITRAFPVLEAFKVLKPQNIYAFDVAYEMPSFDVLDKPVQGLTSYLIPFLATSQGISYSSLAIEGVVSGFYRPMAAVSTLPVASALRLLRCAEKEDGEKVTFIQSPALLTTHHILSQLDTHFLTMIKNANVLLENASPLDTSSLLPKDIRKQIGASLAQHMRALFFNNKDIVRFFAVNGVDFTFILSPYVHGLIDVKLTSMIVEAIKAVPFYAQYTNAVLLSGGMTFESFVCTRAAKLAGIKTINYHKGGLLGYAISTMIDRYDFGEADYFITYGSGAVKNLSQPLPNYTYPQDFPRAQPIPIGSPWVWDIFSQKPQEKKANNPIKICYICDLDIGDHKYLALQRSSFSIMSSFFKIINVFQQQNKVELAVKLYPHATYGANQEMYREYIESLHAPHIKILDNCTIASIAHEFDVFIHEYCGTPTSELAATDATHIMFMDKNLYILYDNAKEILTETTYFFDEEEEFIQFLHNFIRNPEAFEPKNMEKFLLSFCLNRHGENPSIVLGNFIQKLL